MLPADRVAIGVTLLLLISIPIWADWWAKYFGHMASVLGLVVSVVGFVWTIRIAKESKSAAERAEEAADEARQSIQKFDAIVEVSQAVTVLTEIMDLHRKGDWPALPSRYTKLRGMLVSVRNSSSTVTDAQRARLAGVLQQVIAIDQKIEACLHSKKNDVGPPRPMSLMAVLKSQLDHLNDTLVELRGRS